MKVLLVGGGGREAALAWALSRSPEFRLLRCAPGNAGIARHAERVRIGADDVDALVEHAVAERILMPWMTHSSKQYSPKRSLLHGLLPSIN